MPGYPSRRLARWRVHRHLRLNSRGCSDYSDTVPGCSQQPLCGARGSCQLRSAPASRRRFRRSQRGIASRKAWRRWSRLHERACTYGPPTLSLDGTTMSRLFGSASRSSLSCSMSAAFPVTQPSEQNGRLSDGPNAFVQLWDANGPGRPWVSVPGSGTSRRPLGLLEGRVSSHCHCPSGIGPWLCRFSQSGLFLHCCPAPLLPDATGMPTGEFCGSSG